MVNYFSQQPKKIFLLDACGALLTFLLLRIVGTWETWFGMPEAVTAPLSNIIVFYALYSFFCYIFVVKWRFYLKGIALANLLYCATTFYFLSCYAPQIKPLGWLYFLGEIAVVLILALWEWRIAAATT